MSAAATQQRRRSFSVYLLIGSLQSGVQPLAMFTQIVMFRPHRTHLYVAIDQPVQLDVIVVFAEWIDEHFGNFQPSNVKAKLECKMNGKNVNAQQPIGMNCLA